MIKFIFLILIISIIPASAQTEIDNEAIDLKPKPVVKSVTIEGTPITDNLRGGSGDDRIYGKDGNDILKGLDGNDKIYGGSGDDVLDGGKGKDTLKGGSGKDTFICDKYDNIVDYNSKKDNKIKGDCDYIDHGIPLPEPTPIIEKKNVDKEKPREPEKDDKPIKNDNNKIPKYKYPKVEREDKYPEYDPDELFPIPKVDRDYGKIFPN